MPLKTPRPMVAGVPNEPDDDRSWGKQISAPPSATIKRVQ